MLSAEAASVDLCPGPCERPAIALDLALVLLDVDLPAVWLTGHPSPSRAS